MIIRVFAFGIAKEIFGGASVAIEAGAGITVEQLKSDLLKQYPKLKQLTSFMIAVNSGYAQAKDVISEGDEVAIIPPVSGG